MDIENPGLSEEQISIWGVCRDFTDDVVIPLIKEKRECFRPPEKRWLRELLQAANELGL